MKTQKTKYILILFLSLFLINSVSYSQEKILLKSKMLGEADFHFDTFYKIIDCGNGKPQILITAFNESGKDLNIAFDIILEDTVTKVTQQINVPFFYIKAFDLFMPTCTDKKHGNLKYDLDTRISHNQIKATIKFRTK
jgi:hypothetical protein